jgi:hypothetical protein
MKLIALFAPLLLVAASTEHPTGSRITPPTLNAVSPAGVSRGATVEVTVEGLNLARASAVYFSDPAVKGRIIRVKELPDLSDVRLGSNGTLSTVDLGPLPPRNQVTMEVDVSPEANIGPVSFRLLTPLGTSPEGRFLIEPYYGESGDKEPNDSAETAVETFLPAILTGAISKPGDVDWFKIKVKAGEALTFLNGAMQSGSTLQPVVAILDEAQNLMREFGDHGGTAESMFAYRFAKAGTYYIRVSDFAESGRASNLYRIITGRFPAVTAAYPLGLERGKEREVTLNGYGLTAKAVQIKGDPSEDDESSVFLRPDRAFNRVRLTLGDDPEVDSSGRNIDVKNADAATVPVTINGRINSPSYFRFHARKGEKLVLEVNARRLGSDLDSVLDIFDTAGKPVERASVRCVAETSITLADRDSASPGLRLLSWSGMSAGDYLMVGGEINRIRALPNGPDEDVLFEAFGGQRLSFFDTTTEAHAVDKPVYKIQVHPAGTQFTPNGLPTPRLYYRNDDGGPGYGKDSLIHFTAAADGDYVVRIASALGPLEKGSALPYRLSIRKPRPDFRLTVTPRNPNVPLGGSIPVTVTAFRMDEFEGPIEVEITGLPSGLSATKAVIAPGQVSTTLLLKAIADAKLDRAIALNVKGTAGAIAHFANPEDKTKLIALMPKADVAMTAETKVVEVEAGQKAQVAVRIQRQNGFGGRVPVEVRNLPPRVFVTNVGLNGVLINEDEDHRSFTIEALPTAEPMEQMIYVSGRIESRSNDQNSYAAPEPILLRVKPAPAKTKLASR